MARTDKSCPFPGSVACVQRQAAGLRTLAWVTTNFNAAAFLIQRPHLDRRKRGQAFNGEWNGESIDVGAIHRGDAPLGTYRHRDARGDGRADRATPTPQRNRRAARNPSRRRRRARPASRSWRSCRSRASRSRSMTPRAGSCARRYRPASRSARRRPASSPSSRRTRTTTRACMTMPGCRTCCASPGTASHCMAGHCPAMRPHMAACECPMALRRSCSTRRGSGCA